MYIFARYLGTSVWRGSDSDLNQASFKTWGSEKAETCSMSDVWAVHSSVGLKNKTKTGNNEWNCNKGLGMERLDW